MPWPVPGPAGEFLGEQQDFQDLVVWRSMRDMALLNYDVFEAFKSAGADDEKARKTAEALARTDGFLEERFGRIEERFVKVDERFVKVDGRFVQVDQRFTRVEAKLDLHSWILGVVVALNVAILVRALVTA
jgi:hypothetical protein